MNDISATRIYTVHLEFRARRIESPPTKMLYFHYKQIVNGDDV